MVIYKMLIDRVRTSRMEKYLALSQDTQNALCLVHIS